VCNCSDSLLAFAHASFDSEPVLFQYVYAYARVCCLGIYISTVSITIYVSSLKAILKRRIIYRWIILEDTHA
jgi:hypothetical protein